MLVNTIYINIAFINRYVEDRARNRKFEADTYLSDKRYRFACALQ